MYREMNNMKCMKLCDAQKKTAADGWCIQYSRLGDISMFCLKLNRCRLQLPLWTIKSYLFGVAVLVVNECNLNGEATSLQ